MLKKSVWHLVHMNQMPHTDFYGTGPVFTPCVSRNCPKTGKNGTSIFTIVFETNSH